MCLYPRKMTNRRYTVTQKNGGVIPIRPLNSNGETDYRVDEVIIPCGNCIECMKQKARGWMIRLNEEIKTECNPYFITFTLSPEALKEICNKENLNINTVNAAAGYAIRHSLEYWRKDHKKSLKHWYITELGHTASERIHIHGIIFAQEPLEFTEIERESKGIRCKWKYWKYGLIFVGNYCSQKTCNYIVKYMTKQDQDHKNYKPQVFCSPGIGRTWIDRQLAQGKTIYKFADGEPIIDYLRTNTGSKVKLPTYYKNYMYNEQEREKIWQRTMDIGNDYILGENYKGVKEIHMANIDKKTKNKNKEFGYGDSSKEWQKYDYNITRNMLLKKYQLEEIRRKKGTEATIYTEKQRKFA